MITPATAAPPPAYRPPPADWPLWYALPPMGALLTAPRTTRAHVRDVLAEWQLGHFEDNAVLIASELVTNAVRQATAEDGTPLYIAGKLPVIQVTLYGNRTRLLIAVYDQAPGTPRQGSGDINAENGRGLELIATLGRWDWHPAPGGKVVRAYLTAAA